MTVINKAWSITPGVPTSSSSSPYQHIQTIATDPNPITNTTTQFPHRLPKTKAPSTTSPTTAENITTFDSTTTSTPNKFTHQSEVP